MASSSSREIFHRSLATTPAAAAPAAAAAAAAAASPSGAGAGSPRATSSAGKKRPRIPENPYLRDSPPQQQQQQHHHHHHDHHQQQQQQQQEHGDAAANEWEGAEILVIGEGGYEVPGRGRLDWCGACGAHVLRADAQVGSKRFVCGVGCDLVAS